MRPCVTRFTQARRVEFIGPGRHASSAYSSAYANHPKRHCGARRALRRDMPRIAYRPHRCALPAVVRVGVS